MVKIAILMERRVGLAVEDFQDHLQTRYAADEANFLPDGHLSIIITREHVIL
jgi:hypothetical protein